MKILSIISLALIVILQSGCGCITKMRYSRGFKSNLEFNLLKKDHESEKRNIALKAKKHQQQISAVHTRNDSIILIRFNSNIPLLVSFKEKQMLLKYTHQKNSINSAPFQLNQRHIKWLKKTEKPIETNSNLAQFFFFLGLGLLIVSSIVLIFYSLGGGIVNQSVFTILTLLVIGSVFMTIAGFILALIGARKIIRSGRQESGLGADIFIIVLFSLLMLLPFTFYYINLTSLLLGTAIYLILLLMYLLL